MKIISYTDIPATAVTNNEAAGIAARVVIGKKDGADHFYMRVFVIAPEGHTPKHSHDWEHEVFFHAGEGEVYCKGEWKPVHAGSIAFIPANEEHQFKNVGKKPLIFACLIPSKAPEL